MKKEENLEKQVKELEKSNRWMKGILLSLIGIFFVGLCVGLGFMLGNNNNKEKDKTEEKDEKKEIEVLSVDSKVVKDLFDIFNESSCYEDHIFQNLNNSVDAKMYLAYRELNESDFTEMKCGDLNDSYVDGNYCAANDEAFKYYGSNETKFQQAIVNEKTKVVKASLLEKKYKEIFGEDVSFTNKTFKLLEGPIAYYDSDNKVYAYFSCECGGLCGGSFEHTLDSIEQNDNMLVLNTTFIDGSYNSSIIYTFKFEESTGNYIFVKREEKENENSISQDLLDDLERKVNASNRLSLSMVLGEELYNGNNKSSIYASNNENYDYMAYLTYNYYLEKTGGTANKWSSNDSSYGPCYKGGQNGYCYVIDKSEILKYDKMLFNVGEKLLKASAYVLLKGDKFYVTDMPYLGGNLYSVSMKEVVSVVKNNDTTITYIATWNYSLNSGQTVKNIDIKFTFKLNDDNEYYLYSAVKA